MASINKAAVTTIYSRDKMLGFDLVIMELIDGITLREWLKYGQNFIDRHQILKEICKNIEELNHEGIHHGDLHCDNVLIAYKNGVIDLGNDKMNAYLIDFGTSIFSGKNISLEREKKLLIETLNALVPEIKELNILDEINYENMKFNIIPVLYRDATYILALVKRHHYFGDTAAKDLGFLVGLIPLYNLETIIKIIKKYSSKDNCSSNVEAFKMSFEYYIETGKVIVNFNEDYLELINYFRNGGELFDIYKSNDINILKEKYLNYRENFLISLSTKYNQIIKTFYSLFDYIEILNMDVYM